MEKRKVLVVEDEPSCLLTLSSILGKLGFETIRASNGEDAIAMLDTTLYAVVTDLNMRKNGLTGIDVAKAAKEIDEKILVVLCSANIHGNHDLGAIDDFVSKPVHICKLVAALQ